MRPLLLVIALVLLGTPAQAAFFGKNKVQYRSFEWRVLETPHFEIHFYDREAEVVEDAARLAERAYAQLSGRLHHDFTRRIPVILYASHSDFQQTNITESFIDIGTGGVTDLLRRRVFLPFTGSYAELEHVLTHELTHAFELDILYDPKANSNAASPFAFAPPLWLMEGLAEYLSKDARDPHNDMWVRDACLAGTLPSIEALNYARDIRVYRLGQSIWQFFGAEFGDDKIGPLLVATRDQKSFDKGMQAVTKISVAEFSDRWRMAMRRRYLPEIGARQMTREFATATVTRRSDESSLLLGANLSPDGEHLAYISDRNLNHELFVRRIDGDDGPRCLVAGETSGDFEALRFFAASTAWSQDGKTLAFSAKAGGEDALYLLDAASGKVQTRLTFGLDEVQTATFSPDGSEIIFVGLSRGQSDLYRVRRDGTDLRRLTQDKYAERDPQWSPDGHSLVYVSDVGPETDFEALRFGRMHLVLMDVDSGAVRDITPFAVGKAVSPAWSGNGESVAFVSDQDGVSNIYILHLPTGQVFRLTDSATGVSGILPTSPALSWARATNRLVFSAFGEGGFDIYRIDDPMQVMKPVEIEPPVIAIAVPAADAAVPAADAAGSDLAPGTELELASAGEMPPPANEANVTTDAGSAIEGETATNDVPAAAATDSAATEPPHMVNLEPANATPFKIKKYRAKLTPDFSSVGTMVGYDTGFAGQSQLQFSDLLGNYNLTVGVGIYGSLKESDLYVSWLNRSSRINYSLSAFQFRRRYGFLGAGRGTESNRQTYRGVQAAAIRPFDKFTRLEASLRLAGVEGRYFLGETPDEVAADGSIETMRSFVGPGLAYVHDSALYGYAGPIKGRRMRLSLEAGIGQLDYATFEADVRQYWNLNKYYTLAGRFYGASSHGPSPQTMYLGGAQSLRGYDYGTLLGNRVMLTSLEFRFPLLRHLALGWPLPLELGHVEGVLFGDAATAWDERWFRTSRALNGDPLGRAALLSGGFGARISLGYMVLKLDWAQLYDTGTGRRTAGSSVALGTDF